MSTVPAGSGGGPSQLAAGGSAPSNAGGWRSGGAGSGGNPYCEVISPDPTFVDTFNPGTCTQPDHKPDCNNGWCRVRAGCFVMGSPGNEWGHAPVEEVRVAVTLTRSFEIMQHEVTQSEWMAAGLANPSGLQPDGKGDCIGAKCPVGNVNWYEALWYANYLSEHATPPLPPCYKLEGCIGIPGQSVCDGTRAGNGLLCQNVTLLADTAYACTGYRLPTDAEWEYSARAGTKTAFYSGDITQVAQRAVCCDEKNLNNIAWYCANSGGFSHPVGLLQPNKLGLFDMSGNADEWVNDASDGRPAQTNVDPGGTFPSRSGTINLRGGSALLWSTTMRSAGQGESSKDYCGVAQGFRLARTLQ